MLATISSNDDPRADSDAIRVNPNRGVPLLTGLGRATGASPLIHAHRLREQLAGTQVDLVISPLRGGMSQGLLMDRACGDGSHSTRFALWCDSFSQTELIDESDGRKAMANLVADSLEQQCVSMSDALIQSPHFVGHALLPPREAVPRFSVSLPMEPARRSGPLDEGQAIREIVFVGPLGRAAGVADFIHAVERLSTTHRFRVVFAVPAKPPLAGIGKEWLGRIATTWRFPFRVVDCASLTAAKALVARRDQLGFTMMNEGCEPECFSCDGSIETSALEDTLRPALRIEKLLAAALNGRARFRVSVRDGYWPEIVERILRLPASPRPSRAEAVAGTTVCILHFNRPGKLAQALASVPRSTPDHPIELIVIDNASTLADIDTQIAALIAGRRDARLLRLDTALPQAAAYNRGMSEAHHEVVIFLDDDNESRKKCILWNGNFKSAVWLRSLKLLQCFNNIGWY